MEGNVFFFLSENGLEEEKYQIQYQPYETAAALSLSVYISS